MSSIDKGYAWVISCACFFIQATLFGTYRSYSLMYKVLLDKFDISRSDASWPFSLCMTVVHLTGPISGCLNQYFSVRAISFWGCLLSAIGVGLGFFASKSIIMIVIGIGIIQGFGIGLTYVQNSAIINQYFDRYRGTAIGISLSGGTVGAFVISYLLELSLSQAPFHYSFLLLAAISLLTLPVCLLLRPFISSSSLEDGQEDGPQLGKKTPEKDINWMKGNCTDSCNNLNAPEYTRKSSLFASNLSNVCLTAFDLKQEEKVTNTTDTTTTTTSFNSTSSSPQSINPSTLSILNPASLKSDNNNDSKHPSLLPSSQLSESTLCSDQEGDSQNNRKDSNCDYNSQNDNLSTIVKSASLSSSSSSLSSAGSQSETLDVIFSILRNKLFQLIALTHLSYFWGSITYTMIIVDYARDRGLTMATSVDLINSFAIGDLVGRLASGLVVDRNIIKLKYITMISTTGIGVLLCLAPFAKSYLSVIVIAALLGLLSGVINILLNQLFCHYIGSDQAALCFGLSAFLSGVATLARPLVVGYFRDSDAGSYKGLLLTMGFCAIITGFLWFLEPFLVRRENDSKCASNTTLATCMSSTTRVTSLPTTPEGFLSGRNNNKLT